MIKINQNQEIIFVFTEIENVRVGEVRLMNHLSEEISEI